MNKYFKTVIHTTYVEASEMTKKNYQNHYGVNINDKESDEEGYHVRYVPSEPLYENRVDWIAKDDFEKSYFAYHDPSYMVNFNDLKNVYGDQAVRDAIANARKVD